MKGPELILVIGVDHRIQYLNDECGPEWTHDIREFQAYVVEQARTRDIDLIAEEFNAELVAKNHAALSTLQEVAGQVSKPHLFCDPDTRERLAGSIADAAQREDVWLARLRSCGARRILFVCGDDHVDSFAGRLNEQGHVCQVLSRGWGNSWRFRR